MKIKSFWIKNFMSWENAQFDMSSNVTIFAGISDKGKSAIMKGFSWLYENKPLGDEFISDWAKKKKKNGSFEIIKECEFGIILKDGTKVSRAKGPNINEYRISTLKDPLKALRTDVPDEVSFILNLSDINIQQQANPHFLIGDSAPDIGRKLNQIASLSDIDVAFKNADGEIRSINSSIRKEEAELERNEDQIKDYHWLDNADKDVLVLEKLFSELSTTRNDEQRLRNQKDRIQNYQKQIDKYSPFIKAKQSIDDLFGLKNDIDKLDSEIERLISAEEKIVDFKEQVKNANKIIDAQKDIQKLIILQKDIECLDSEIEGLIDIEKSIQKAEENLMRAKQKYELINQEYVDLKSDTCPLCGGEWGK